MGKGEGKERSTIEYMRHEAGWEEREASGRGRGELRRMERGK